MKNRRQTIRPVRVFLIAGLLGLGWTDFDPIPSCAAEQPTPQATPASESPQAIRKSLIGKRFKFYWKSSAGNGFNAVATLNEDGSITGIQSPNESTWLVDDTGRLVFKHTDGRISTRFEKTWRQSGITYFEGPFRFRNGIVHTLIETGTTEGKLDHAIAPQQSNSIQYSRQQFVYLDLDATETFRLHDGTQKEIRLRAVKETRDSVVELVRRAEVTVEIDGKPLRLICGPYVMPTEFEGLRIQADTTSAWLAIPKRVQFSLWDASDPIVDTQQFGFPLPGYRLFSHGMQAYNEPVHLGYLDGDPGGQCFYHNYGVDFAGYEARQKVASCIDGVVAQVDRESGTLSIEDEHGFVLVFCHLDSILQEIEPGQRVDRGQWIGMIGRRGAAGNFSHLHVGAYLSGAAKIEGRMSRNLNLYPWLVVAYRAGTGNACHAVARPHHVAQVGETVVFDGTQSLVQSSDSMTYRWQFHDGTTVTGARAEKAYDRPGCYMAALWIEGEQGVLDVDFCKVKVFSQPTPEASIPTLFVTYKPAGIVRVGQPVNFRIWPQGAGTESITVDFGDGGEPQEIRPYSATTHQFKAPGIHIVTASTRVRHLSVTQQVKITVQDGPAR